MSEQAGAKEGVQHALEKTRLEDFRLGYMETFDVGAPEPPCPPYEGVYLKGVERSGHLIRLAEFYQHFGLKMNPEEGKRELMPIICGRSWSFSTSWHSRRRRPGMSRKKS